MSTSEDEKLGLVDLLKLVGRFLITLGCVFVIIVEGGKVIQLIALCLLIWIVYDTFIKKNCAFD